MHRATEMRRTGLGGRERGDLADGEDRRCAEGGADGEGQRGRTEEGTRVHASVLMRGRGENFWQPGEDMGS